MKSQDIDNLYKSLTNHERAALTFKAMCNGDSEQCRKIHDSVPKVTYRCSDKEYSYQVDVFFEIATIWTIEYWKKYCKMIAVMGLLRSDTANKDQNRIEQLDTLHYEHRNHLFALFLILNSLHTSHHLDKKSILTFADIWEDFSDKCTLEDLSDEAQDYYHNYLSFFISELERTDLNPEVAEYLGINGNEPLEIDNRMPNL